MLAWFWWRKHVLCYFENTYNILKRQRKIVSDKNINI